MVAPFSSESSPPLFISEVFSFGKDSEDSSCRELALNVFSKGELNSINRSSSCLYKSSNAIAQWDRKPDSQRLLLKSKGQSSDNRYLSCGFTTFDK